jgi:hypothetical protein
VARMDPESGPADGPHQGGRDRCQGRQLSQGSHDRRRRPIAARVAAGGRGRGEDPPARVVADRHRDQGTARGDRFGLGTGPVQADPPRGGRQGGSGGSTLRSRRCRAWLAPSDVGSIGRPIGPGRSATIPWRGEAWCAPPGRDQRGDRGGQGSSWRMRRAWGRHDPDDPSSRGCRWE